MKKILFLLCIITFIISFFSISKAIEFRSGKPIWPEGREKGKNLFVGFRAVFKSTEGENIILRVTGSTLYRIYVNGKFSGYGPARGPQDFFRIDEWDITQNLLPGDNIIAIEIAGYNVNSYYVLNQPSFLQAEVLADDKVLASTAGEGAKFDAIVLKERVQKVQRYSFQRPFSEVYKLFSDYSRWRTVSTVKLDIIPCSIQLLKKTLPRRVPYPKFSLRQPLWDVSHGKIEQNISVEKLWKDRSLTAIGPKLGGYPESELEVIPSIELQKIKTVPIAKIDQPFAGKAKLNIAGSSYHILDFGTNLTGFLGAQITCKEKTRLFFTFDEILTQEDVNFKRMGCVNIVSYEIPPGVYSIESFEPYTLRYLKLIVFEGSCDIENIYLREYTNPDVYESHFAASDERLNVLFSAGRETFRQNAVDVFMDCPSRERAGWLCDSYFTSRAGNDLSGNTIIEKNFFENFLLPPQFANIPDGMLPMCYPSDHYDGVFIPNWALWFVIQLEEYLNRSEDRRMIDEMQPKILNLFNYFKKFQNEDGLLEKLESWVFVEWSKANSFVQDVNYPSNMLYAAALESAGRMYGVPDLSKQAEKIREVIRKQSFDGDFFVDNAIRTEGKLQATRNRTEVCQYFAFYFNVATPQSHPKLWSVLCEQFGPQRKQTKAYPEIHEANSFVGNMLRFEIFSRYARCQNILDESIAYLIYMADQTGTLWENVGDYASCNHGFASHIVHTLYRDVLGVFKINPVNKNIQLRFTNIALNWCEGRIPVTGGAVNLRWWKDGQFIYYRLNIPAGYSVDVESRATQKLIRLP